MEKKERNKEEGLRGFILSQIEKRGPILFSQFMEWCLYHPEYGYYRSEKIKIGKDGDYYTGPCVHPFFGCLIAKQLLQMAEIMGSENFCLVEMGGDRGFLCKDILDWLSERNPTFYQYLRYYLIETAPHVLKQQKVILSEHEGAGRVFWLSPEAFKNGQFETEGCFLSNELIDAFPVHRVMLDHGSFKEMYVNQKHGQLEEEWGELSDKRLFEYFRSMNITLDEGQKAEVNLEALDWVERVERCLKKGFVLTIDYGFHAEELYAADRREGTLLCYHNHQTSENPFEKLGEQDITAHVNFTSLIKKGEEVGLHFTGLVPQYRFLIGLGILEEMESLRQGLSEIEGLGLSLSLKHLIEPEAGMGEVFKVLIQHKGVENPQLDGLRELGSISFGEVGGQRLR
jgi:SAM-dependent MidA family methyltransferase